MFVNSTDLRQTLEVHANLNSHLHKRINFMLQINLLHLTGNSIRSIEINDVNSINKIRMETLSVYAIYFTKCLFHAPKNFVVEFESVKLERKSSPLKHSTKTK